MVFPAGGVLPNLHPELLKSKKGSKPAVQSTSPVTKSKSRVAASAKAVAPPASPATKGRRAAPIGKEIVPKKVRFNVFILYAYDRIAAF